MARQDKTGTKYEQFLAATLASLGYTFNGSTGKNYLHPTKSARLVFPDTYIQPDLVVRENLDVKAILYATHWSNTRSSKYKFWRTWEELAQQKLAVSRRLIGINCLFEALPENCEPQLYITSHDIPIDQTRDKEVPLQFNGWDAGIGWAVVEAFDVTLAFPVGYRVLDEVLKNEKREDLATKDLLERALGYTPKQYLNTQYDLLDSQRLRVKSESRNLSTTKSTYRVGLLHIYLMCRFIQYCLSQRIEDLEEILEVFSKASHRGTPLDKLMKTTIFANVKYQNILELFNRLSSIQLKHKNKNESFCRIERMTNQDNPSFFVDYLSFNTKLNSCFLDLSDHLQDSDFINAINQSFRRFDEAYGVDEAIFDLANVEIVKDKGRFVRDLFLHSLQDEERLNDLLQLHAKSISLQRIEIASDNQNWVFEMLLYLCGLNSSEDIQKKFKGLFEESGHKLRAYAPYGGHAQTVAFLLQGRDICEQWSSRGRRTLTQDEFRTLAWQTVAKCIIRSLQDLAQENKFLVYPPEKVIDDYLRNKLMRILSSDLNGFNIMIEHYLSDICFLKFTDDKDVAEDELKETIRISWQTEIISNMWNSQPLSTYVEGVSRNNKWIIKFQSSQDGNEGHKTKELAGRCRALRIGWSHGEDPRNRDEWSFYERDLPKLALVLDGDWSIKQKQNLYEAGWDWVGDVSQLGELHQLIQADDPD